MVRRLKGSATLDENAILRAHARAHLERKQRKQRGEGVKDVTKE